jgi:hypothetical protein
MSEQPDQPKRKAPRAENRLASAANDYELADASALKALHSGTADAHQQRRALDWILKSACGLPDWPYVVGDPDQTHIHLGRQYVGQLIMKLIQVNLGSVRRKEPNADKEQH